MTLTELQDYLDKDGLRLSVQEAMNLTRQYEVIRGSAWLTQRVFQAVERSGYDRGHAVATAECNATEPTEYPDDTILEAFDAARVDLGEAGIRLRASDWLEPKEEK